MHYLLSKVGKGNKYRITFHNNMGITYGNVIVYADPENFNSFVVSTSDYERCSTLVNTVADGIRYAYVTKKDDGFAPIYNISDKPKFIKFGVNSYFKATMKWATPARSAGG